MRKYHHLGIPTTDKRDDEVHLKHLKVYVSGYPESPYHIEWMRYESDAPYPDLVKTVPHVAFEVDDLEEELEGKKVIIAPNSPSLGVTVAFIEDNGAPVELLQIDNNRAVNMESGKEEVRNGRSEAAFLARAAPDGGYFTK